MLYKVMIVDDNMSNLIMAQKTLEEEYEVLPINSGISALEVLNDMPDLPDLVVLDIDMPNVNGFQVISEMKNVDRLKDIPIIFLTAQDDVTTELESYNLGAMDDICKPYTASLLKKRINVQIQILEQKRELADINNLLTNVIQGQRKKETIEHYAIVEMLVSMLGSRNTALAAHANRIERYMAFFLSDPIIAAMYGLDEEKIKTMCVACRVHDVGKICMNEIHLSDVIFEENKEFDNEVDKMHTVVGADGIKN